MTLNTWVYLLMTILLALPWFFAVATRYLTIATRYKGEILCKRWEQYLCWKTALTAHLLLLYQYSQTLSDLIFLLRHHFQGHCLELSLELTVVRMYLYVCLTPFLFWGFQKFIIFTKLWNYKKQWLTQSSWCIYLSIILQYCMVQYKCYTHF